MVAAIALFKLVITQVCMNVCTCMLRPLRWLGCFCLVGLEFLASLHLHGAVDNPVRSQRLQPLHFHDHHLRSTDTSVKVADRRRVIHLSKQVIEQKVNSRCEGGKSFEFDRYFRNTIPATITIHTRSWCFHISRFSPTTAHKIYSHPSCKVQLSITETARGHNRICSL